MTDILVVDDEPDIRGLIGDILEDEGHGTRMAWDSDTAFGEINRAAPDLIILDIWLKDSRLDGIDILKRVRRDNPAIPVVIISGHGNIEIAVAAIKQGAYDFIEKPFNIDQLMVVIGRALETSRLRRENAALKGIDAGNHEMLGTSSAFRQMKSQLDKVARTNSRVMLTGPAGSGKDVAARYIHRNSDRAKGPFVIVSSASVGAEQMEEVLFGREGSERGVEPGLFERAHTGILFFDEVADMPQGTQSKILRVLVDQAFQRVGGTDTVRVDVRVLSATTRDLAKEVASGRFRTELFHRLNVVPVTVPGLEARREDIPLLAGHFLEELNSSQGLPQRSLSPEAEAQLQTMRWPGNVRQLRNTLERALILGADHGPIQPEELANESSANGAAAGGGLGSAFAGLALREAREVFEREYLVAQINRFGGNISRTASFVGMERSALHRKLKSLNVISAGRNVRAEEAEENA
ncbi:MAG TPA: sigma-54 dependent transcriptional regulator [Amaricoccus sp.]|uniref:nitrogen assimilation response regulator NtrX n=1 Tax=Amaricoccus sp. TaxID=1872485 RepID=UPI002BD3BB43|nr:sigma-54 dependent transcriptional regulator [Amaricoccus sp.]HPG22065.1 sigma-54 dependent transcriptional regulator [Amaricoccus sp.]HRW14622.1 sigma-54 dependent transcriptional regulator [Amaricoccus sp.]